MRTQPFRYESPTGHPFRRALALPGVSLRPQRHRHPFRAQLAAARRYRDDHDLRLFVLSFTAFFVCFSTFLA